MVVKFGEDKSGFGPGIVIDLSGDEVATAIDAYLVAHNVNVFGPRTIRVNGKTCENGEVYVDPSGVAVVNGIGYNGKTGKHY